MEKCGNILTSLIFLTPDIDWIMIKVILKGNSNGGNVEVRVCLPRLDLIPINKVSLSRGDIREPVRKLLSQIKGFLKSRRIHWLVESVIAVLNKVSIYLGYLLHRYHVDNILT